MNRKEFYNIVKTEGFNKYNIGDFTGNTQSNKRCRLYQ